MEKEIIKEIPGATGYYISNLGKLYTTRKMGRGKYFLNEKREIKPRVLNTGYLRAQIWYDNGKKMGGLLHRLVATIFIPNPNNLPIVLHKDNNILNNIVDNLKWGTLKENQQQCGKEGRRNNGTSVKITFANGTFKKFKSQNKAAKFLNITSTALSRIILKERKPLIGIKIKRLNKK